MQIIRVTELVNLNRIKRGQRVKLKDGNEAVIRHNDRAMNLVVGTTIDGYHSFIWTYDGLAVGDFSQTMRWFVPNSDIVEIC